MKLIASVLRSEPVPALAVRSLYFILALAFIPIRAFALNSEVPITQILSRPQVHFSSLDSMTLSPDGKWVAYVLMRRLETPHPATRYLPNGVPRDQLGTQIKLSPVGEKGAERDICPLATSCFRPSWSPDGQRVAYYSDEGGALGLWEYDVRKGRAQKLVSKNVKVALKRGDEPVWTQDGKTILFMVRNPENLKAISQDKLNSNQNQAPFSLTSGVSFVKKTADFENWMTSIYREELKGSIAEVSLDSKKIRVIRTADSTPEPSIFRLSPSRRWISYLSVGERQTRALAIFPREGGKPRMVAEGLRHLSHDSSLGNYQWHPKRDLLVFIKDGALWSWDIAQETNAPRPLRPEIHDAIDFPLLFTETGGELIVGRHSKGNPDDTDEGPSTLAMVPLDEGKPIRQFQVPDGGEFAGLLQLNSQTAWSDGASRFVAKLKFGSNYRIVGYSTPEAPVHLLTEGTGRIEFSPRGGHEQGTILAWLEDVHTVKNLFRFTDAFRVREPITRWGSDVPQLDGMTVKWFELKTKKSAGKESNARIALLLPRELKRSQLPSTVIFAYPGANRSTYANDFSGGDPVHAIPAEILLRAGMAVALVDLPIGPEGKPGEPLQEMTDVLVEQIGILAKSGLVDQDRFALIGQSYGGYMAAAVASATSKLKAVIAISGIYDLASNYGLIAHGAPFSIDWSETGQGRMGGPLWSDPERYLRNSPYFRADKIHTPLLLVHGTQDEGYLQSAEMFTALNRLGSPAELITYPGEGHAPSDWTLTHQVDLIERILAFLERYL